MQSGWSFFMAAYWRIMGVVSAGMVLTPFLNS